MTPPEEGEDVTVPHGLPKGQDGTTLGRIPKHRGPLLHCRSTRSHFTPIAALGEGTAPSGPSYSQGACCPQRPEGSQLGHGAEGQQSG